MTIKSTSSYIDLDSLPVSNFWSERTLKEIKMHKIHAYPARFPSLVVKRSLEYARANNLPFQTIADVFCGCGTTALEARLNSLNFWGCDINPVATLIARAKSHNYSERILVRYSKIILKEYQKRDVEEDPSLLENKRIKYWFARKQREDLFFLLTAIRNTVREEKYSDFFLCAFSNILKGSSRWLTKSIKPQVDPQKIPADVLSSFQKQVEFMIAASRESKNNQFDSKRIKIRSTNFLKCKVRVPFVDMVITSPPYATSYEYADLHQLSVLWLGYAKDFRDLRDGTIGSLYHKSIEEDNLQELQGIGRQVFQDLSSVDKSKAKSVAKYFLDMHRTVEKVRRMVRENGNAVFIVGNTEYKGIKVDNTRFLIGSLLENGFSQVKIFKRKIGAKSLTPYRDKDGKFSTDANGRRVYDYEFVLLAGNN